MSYGQIALLAGQPQSARQVARILHSMSQKYGLPWHRVVNAKGKISVRGADAVLQKNLLESEGVIFYNDHCIDRLHDRVPKKKDHKRLGEVKTNKLI